MLQPHRSEEVCFVAVENPLGWGSQMHSWFRFLTRMTLEGAFNQESEESVLCQAVSKRSSGIFFLGESLDL